MHQKTSKEPAGVLLHTEGQLLANYAVKYLVSAELGNY